MPALLLEHSSSWFPAKLPTSTPLSLPGFSSNQAKEALPERQGSPVVGGALQWWVGLSPLEAGIPGGPSTRKRVPQLGRPHAASLSLTLDSWRESIPTQKSFQGAELLASRWDSEQETPICPHKL